MRPQTISALLLFGLLAAAPASASPDPGARRVTVRFDDLDVHAPAGVAALDGRLRAAANVVCGPAPLSPAELTRAQAFRHCRRTAIAEARAQVAQADFTPLQPRRRHGD